MRVFLFCKPHTPPDVPPPHPSSPPGLAARRGSEPQGLLSFTLGPSKGTGQRGREGQGGPEALMGWDPSLRGQQWPRDAGLKRTPVTSMAGNCPGALVTFTHHPAALFQLSLDLGPRTFDGSPPALKIAVQREGLSLASIYHNIVDPELGMGPCDRLHPLQDAREPGPPMTFPANSIVAATGLLWCGYPPWRGKDGGTATVPTTGPVSMSLGALMAAQTLTSPSQRG